MTMAVTEDELGITHQTMAVNGITMHVAEKGKGPAVVLLHGFPELWYSWRHQIAGLANRGFRAIAPDLRGYGDTSAPPDVHSYSIFHLVGDIIALLDALSLSQVFVVGHDWGAMIAWNLCTFRPERVKAFVSLSVPFQPRKPDVKPIDHYRSLYGDDFYICKFQTRGMMEIIYWMLGAENFLKRTFSLRSPEPPLIRFSWKLLLSLGKKVESLTWISQKDINYYTSKLCKSGFTCPINYYRCLDLNWEQTAPWGDVKIKVPVKFIVGDLDLTYHQPGVQDYIHKGGFKADCPLLEEVVVMENVAHFINQEKAHEITEHIYEFIQKF